MSIRIMSRVWDTSTQSGGHLLVLLALADFSDDNGRCYPSLTTIARKARLDARHVRRVLRDLESSGELLTVSNAGPGGVNVYVVGRVETTPDNLPSPGYTDPHPPGAHAPTPRAPTPPRTVIEPSIESTTAARTADMYPEAFEEIWKAYPKRDGDNPKRRAFKAYRARINEGISTETMLAGTRRYAAWVRARNKEGTEVVKQAATFLGPDKCFLAEWVVEKRETNKLYDRFPVV